MRKITFILCCLVAFFATISTTFAQGVTTAAIGGVVKDTKGEGLPGATVVAIHVPSGTKYATATQPDGRFVIQGMRVGGPYAITTTFIGFQDQTSENVYLSLGTTTNLNVKLSESTNELTAVTVVSSKGAVISGDRTGAATNIAREQIERMPTISRNFADMTRLTPQASGNSFGGRNGGFNNVTIDGAIFNNSFGLSPTIGGQASAQPISLDAIEQVQVSIAPFDVRQGSFTGAGVNAVTRSGTNTLSGSVFMFRRTDALQGFKVGDAEIPRQDLSNWQYGFRLGGPIIKNKLFFFVNGELEDNIRPSTSFQPNRPGLPPPSTTSNTSAASAAELNDLRNFITQNLGFNPGTFESFDLRTYSQKATAKLDWNISDKHKFSIKYNYLMSYADIAPSNSGAITTRNPGQFTMPFQSSYYTINNNLNSVIAELNSRFSNEVSNTFQIGYTAMRDFRESPLGDRQFPMVDIGNGSGQQLTSFGYEPFTVGNKLNTDVFQFSNNLTVYKGKHTLTFGTYNEFYRFANGFAPNYYGNYQFATVDAFKAAVRVWQANEALKTNPNGPQPDANDLTLGAPSRYQLRYSALPDGSFPLPELSAFQIGLYAQDEIAVRNNLNLTLGLRVDIPVITSDIIRNPISDNMTFRDGLKVDVSRLQGVTPLWSPRVGFNWDVFNNKKTQVRGGTGIFTGRVPYVWISNQISNTGALFGSIDNQGTSARTNLFNPNVNTYIPSSRLLAPNSSFNLAFTDPNFKFPQVWRTNIALDQELPWGIIGTLEGIYTADINAVYLENVNLPTARGRLSDIDGRPTYFTPLPVPTTPVLDPNGNPIVNGRIYSNVTDAIQLRNTTQGYSWNLTAQLQKNFGKSLFASIAYNYMDSRSVNDGGSIAQSQWRDRPISGDPNATALSFSNFMVRQRFIASVSYRKEYLKHFATSISVFFEAAPNGRVSYVYQGDANGDNAGGNNDLLFVPRTRNDINLVDINGFSNGVPFTYAAAQQWADLDKYLSQDPYLSTVRGQYVDRNGMELPMFAKADLSIRQDFILNPSSNNRKQTLQLSFDVFNFTNMLNSAWGVEQILNRSNLINFVGREAGTGRPQYSFPYLDNATQTPLTSSFRNSTGLGSRWVAQFGIRYIFN